MMTKHQAPSVLMMIMTMMSSTLMMVTSTNWIMMWLAMEMNLMAVIPLMNTSKMSYESESTIKYFLVQTSSSIFLLTSLIMFMSSSLKGMSTLLIMTSLMMKLGMAPFHIWLPQVLNGLTWPMIILITTWQKIGPLAILSYTMHMWKPSILLMVVSMSALVGSLGGINQTQMRPLIAYSSISHMAWMLASSSISNTLTLSYFSLYSFITIMLILPIKSMSKLSTNEFNMSNQLSANMSSSTMIHLLSLGGMPPLLGFIPKWMAILALSKSMILMPTILILSSLISLFYYLSIFFSSNLNIYKPLKSNFYTSSMPLLIPMNLLPTLILISLL